MGRRDNLAGIGPAGVSLFFVVRPAGTHSNRCESIIRPVLGRI